MQADIGNVLSRLECVAARLERFEASLHGTTSAATSASNAAPSAAVVQQTSPDARASGAPEAAYSQMLNDALQPLIACAAAVGGDVLQATTHVGKAFMEQGTLIALAAKAKAPSPEQLQTLLQPVGAEIMAANSLAEQRRSPAFLHNKAVAEALHGLSWLAYTGPACGMHAPAQHIGESWHAAEFYANKLLMEFRGKDEDQVAWVRTLKDLFAALQAYVAANHTAGLKWSPSGVSVEDAKAQLAAGTGASSTSSGAHAAAAGPGRPAAGAQGAAAAARPGAPPAAPPPPPPGLLLQERPAKGPGSGAGGIGGGGSAMQDLFKELSKGAAVTSGLRKVTDDMKTKNQADRGGLVTAAPPQRAAAGAAAPKSAVTPSRPPRVALEQDAKWVVENQGAGASIVLDNVLAKHAVYIYNCAGSVVQIKGKVKSIGMDTCKKTGIVFEDVIAACEVVNCSSVQVQCTGTVPIVSIDKCDGCQVFLPQVTAAPGADFQLVTAKSSEVNVTVVAADPEKEDSVELAVPEQFISKFDKDGRLVTVAASHSGG